MNQADHGKTRTDGENDAPTARSNASRRQVALALLQWLDREFSSYAILGAWDDFPDSIPSDIDVAVPECEVDRSHEGLGRFCREYGLLLVQMIRHVNGSYCVLAWFARDGRPNYIALDFNPGYWLRGRRVLSDEDLLRDRFQPIGADGERKPFYVPAWAAAFGFYFLKKVVKQDLTDRSAAYLSSCWEADPVATKAFAGRYWTGDDLSTIAAAAESNDWNALKAALPNLKRSLDRRFTVGLLTSVLDLPRMARRLLAPNGLCVAFLGPDGSGKSTVIGSLQDAVSPAFWQHELFHLRPPMVRGSHGSPVTAPHARPPRGWIPSVAKLFYFLLIYNIGYVWKVYIPKSRSGLVIFDRYYADILVDPLRYRYGGPMWLARAVGGLIPQPDLWIVLDAPADVLQARVKEVSYEETARQRQAYCALGEALDNAVIIDAARPIERVTTDAVRVVLNCMAKRLAGRIEQRTH